MMTCPMSCHIPDVPTTHCGATLWGIVIIMARVEGLVVHSTTRPNLVQRVSWVLVDMLTVGGAYLVALALWDGR